MKKLLLPLTFICFFVSTSMMAQNTNNNNSVTKKVQRKGPKMSKNNAVVRINEVPSNRAATVTRANKNTARKQRIVETNTSNNRRATRKVNHREMIAKRKKIEDNH